MLPPEFHVTDADGTLRVEWDNRRVKADWDLIPLTFVWLCIAVMLVMCFLPLEDAPPGEEIGPCFAPLFLVLLGVISVIVPRRLVARTWRECVQLSRDALTHTRTGWLAPEPDVYPVAGIDRLVLERKRPDDSPAELVPCGIQIYPPTRRTLLSVSGRFAERLAADAQEQLYLTIRDFVAANGIPLEVVVMGDPPSA